jgi:hypothetical protein
LSGKNAWYYFGDNELIMKRKKKTILSIMTLLFLVVAGYGFYLWFKPHRDVTNEKGIEITAEAIFDSFSTNEIMANERYLNKAIQVTGEVTQFKKNQSGQTVVYLKSSDAVYGVNCTFKDDPGPLQKNSVITFKGICTGYLGDKNEPGDVVINQGIIVKK